MHGSFVVGLKGKVSKIVGGMVGMGEQANINISRFPFGGYEELQMSFWGLLKGGRNGRLNTKSVRLVESFYLGKGNQSLI